MQVPLRFWLGMVLLLIQMLGLDAMIHTQVTTDEKAISLLLHSQLLLYGVTPWSSWIFYRCKRGWSSDAANRHPTGSSAGQFRADYCRVQPGAPYLAMAAQLKLLRGLSSWCCCLIIPEMNQFWLWQPENCMIAQDYCNMCLMSLSCFASYFGGIFIHIISTNIYSVTLSSRVPPLCHLCNKSRPELPNLLQSS